MSNFEGILLLILIHFFLYFSLIVILHKLDNYCICPLGKSFMHGLILSIMFVSLGQLATEILVML